MKRKLVLTSAVVLILALLAAGTFAYFTKDARATNVITTTLVEVIASISMDHMDVLGDTLEKIAFEKAGITRPFFTVSSALSGRANAITVSVAVSVRLQKCLPL